MRILPRLLSSAFATLLCSVFTYAQAPRLFLRFDGDLADSSVNPVAGLSLAPSAGYTAAYASDRNGQPNKALVVPGSASLQVLVPSTPGSSEDALGVRGSATTPFTLAAWVSFDGVGAGQGFNTIFGNTGSGAGTLHAGLGNNADKAHFGFDNGNDANGAVVSFGGGVWYHVAFVFDGSSQRVYINGVPEVTRTGVVNTLKAADLFIGNWGAPNDPNNDLRGRLDDLVVYDVALPPAKVQALFNGLDPNALPLTYSAPKLPGISGNTNSWGVREIKAYPGISYASLVDADRIIKAYAQTPAGTVADYQAPVINLNDPDAPGDPGAFANEGNFATNVDTHDDDDFLVIARGAVRIAVEDDYTFGFIGDEGSRLRVLNQTFISSSAANGSAGNPAIPAHQGDGIYWTGGTTNSGTLGVVHLGPGDYNLELTYWEAAGGASVEVFAARGAKTAIDSTFQLVGNTAAGGLALVRDPDTYPSIQSFTANGGGSLFIHGGAPASFTLAWQTNGAVVPGTNVSIDQGIGPVAASGSSIITSPAQTTTYTITASNGVETATRTLTVYVNSPPVLTSFTSSAARVEANADVTLSWVVDGADTLTLQPGNIDVTGQTSRVVNPAAATTYTLVATNPSGTSQQSVTVQVGFPPTISSFIVTDTDPLFGADTALSWVTSNATTLSINQGIGAVPGPNGSVSIIPLQTTTYTLTATNAAGTTTATATVNQPVPIGVTSARFTARRVFATAATPFPFAGQGYLQSAISLIGTGPNTGQNELREASQGNYATVNFSDGADGDFPGGTAFPGAASGTNYAVQITATLVVNTPGKYTFEVNSSYGSRLRIDGQDVIVDDGSHYPGSSTGSINLIKPTAQLELISYGVSGSSEVELGWIRPNLQFALLTSITPAPPIVRGKLLLSEFMADNGSTLLDEDGGLSDWLEIWNSTNASVNLAGTYLTDDAAIPNKWALPAWTLDPNQYLIVFASAKSRKPAQAVAGQDNPGTLAQPHLHTNFKLSKIGGSLILNQDDGAGGFTAVSAFTNYPPQQQDVSYGSSDVEGYIGFMEVPTPGNSNAATVVDFVSDTSFDHDRGRYTVPFNLAITTPTTDATIRYTTDGSTPTVNHGTIYTGPISITRTTVVRAAAFKPGWKSTGVDTETYLFINDVATQTTATATAIGFPSGSVNGQVFRYGMTLANVTTGGGTLQSLKDALVAAPTVCMTTDIGNLTTPASGIYVNPGRHGLFWERPVSLEYINLAGTSEFQINCGARIRGGFSRDPNNPKHAFHLFFRKSLYDGSLNYKLFGNGGASTFSQIDMRCEENYSWSYQKDSRNSLVREEWSRVTQGAMGEPQSRTGYFHLYINGIYWGIYNWEERTEAAYGETYLGGTAETTDVIKSAGNNNGYLTEATDGNFGAWQSLFNQCVALKRDAGAESSRTARYMQMRGLNPDGTRNPAYPVLLDVDNLIDYLLIIFYDGSFDAPLSTFLNNGSNNWFGVRDRNATRGFAFFTHDNEHGFDTMTQSYNRVGPWGGSGTNNWMQGQYGTRETFNRSNPQYLHELLAYSAEYRLRFADRVEKHLFNGGALTTAAALARYNALVAQVAPIIHAEAARWGSTSLNRNAWSNAVNTGTNFINNGGTPMGGQTVFPVQQRTSMIVTQLKGYTDAGAKPFFPSLGAPTFSGQFGGAVPSAYSFQVSNPGASGIIYYTVNGVDPREIGGLPAASAQTGPGPVDITLNNTATVRARIYDSTAQTWSALTEAEYLVGPLASSSSLVVSKINYNPPGAGDLQEFLEVMNIGAVPIDLTNVQFTLGVQFQFPDGYILAPGSRALIVRDMAAFAAAYPNVPPAQIVGVFANGTNLANGGARLQLLDAAGAVIQDFTYDNNPPWPTSVDGGGPCLVLIRPETNPDPSDPANWRASSIVGGTPGSSDAQLYAAWAAANNVTDLQGTADDDNDGLSNLAEYALGSNPKVSSSAALPAVGTQAISVGSAVSDYLTITFTRTLGHDDVAIVVEETTDLAGSWSPAVIVGSPTFNGDGTETLVYRFLQPQSAQPQQFLRLRITRRP